MGRGWVPRGQPGAGAWGSGSVSGHVAEAAVSGMVLPTPGHGLQHVCPQPRGFSEAFLGTGRGHPHPAKNQTEPHRVPATKGCQGSKELPGRTGENEVTRP